MFHIPAHKNVANPPGVVCALSRGRQTFLSDQEDLDWLRDVHLRFEREVPPFRSAVLTGNEDSPDMIELYADEEPVVFQSPVATYFPNLE